MTQRTPLIAMVGIAAAMLLGACTPPASPPTADKPQVRIDGGTIAVAPDPLDFTSRPGEVLITWSLPANSAYTFGGNGIVIEDSKEPPVRAAEEFVECAPGDKGKSFSCRNLHKGKGRHKYTIYVRDGDKELPPFDPLIHN